jgi:aminotransferase
MQEIYKMTESLQSRSIFKNKEQVDNLDGIATRVSQITVSAIKQMPLLASEIGGCVSLGQGIPSMNTPAFILESIVNELHNNLQIGKYSLQPGLPELKQAIAADLKRTKKVGDIDAQNEIFISCGGMEALATGITTIVERGDEVILPSPTYASHIEQVLFAEGQPRFVPLIEELGWKLDIDGMRKAISKKTKAIILCNPVNPTGTVFSETDLRAIAEIVLENDLFLVLDEAYDFLVYDNTPYFSLISMPELKEHIICAGSFSKRYCMTGWRVGFMYASAQIIRQALKVHDAFAICAPTISQYAALAALRATDGKNGLGDQSIKLLIDTLTRRRNLVCERLDRLEELFSYVSPQGSYYVFPKLKTNNSSIDFALKLLHEARVITIPGNAFGPTGEGHLRISFGAAEEELNEAFNRIEKYWAAV